MFKKPNYLLKSAILQEDICDIVKKYDFLDYKKTDFLKGLDIESAYTELLWNVGLQVIKEARRINNAQYKRVQRLKDRIRTYLFSGRCIFITLEFDDETLSNTNFETRRKYITRYLKSKSDYYIANVDYGDEKGREHYHGVLLTDWVANTWEYGYAWHEVVRCSEKDVTKIAKYVSILTNHAIKESNKRNVYIYSRNKREL